MSEGHTPRRDVFLSHRSTDKEIVRALACDIEAQPFGDRTLTVWLDEAEIRTGQSVPGMINDGLERSRFVGLIMTPAYFQSASGWTDAEWHAALHLDPDNRRGRIIPLLMSDCPYIPILLRHLSAIDFRGNRRRDAFQELLVILRDEPLPRPISYRGQLITPAGLVDRATIIAARAVPQANPDVVQEHLHCNLLPVRRLPDSVYSAPIAQQLYKARRDGTLAAPSKQEIKDAIRLHQESVGVEHPFVPAFRVVDERIITFHDLESPEGAFAAVVDLDDVEATPADAFLQSEEDRKLLVSLLNMALDRHAIRVGLTVDATKKGRYFFPPVDGKPNVVTWIPVKNRASRTVAKPCTKDGHVLFWRHQGAFLRMLFLANKFYLKITPTWVITEDGIQVRGGPKVGAIVINWTGAERNLHLLYHVRFWSTVLRRGPGAISIRAGDQWLEIATVPALIQQSYGIKSDQRDLMRLLDHEAVAIAELEDELGDAATIAAFDQSESDEDATWEPDDEDEDAEPDVE